MGSLEKEGTIGPDGLEIVITKRRSLVRGDRYEH
jgi:hypothetical protein